MIDTKKFENRLEVVVPNAFMVCEMCGKESNLLQTAFLPNGIEKLVCMQCLDRLEEENLEGENKEPMTCDACNEAIERAYTCTDETGRVVFLCRDCYEDWFDAGTGDPF